MTVPKVIGKSSSVQRPRQCVLFPGRGAARGGAAGCVSGVTGVAAAARYSGYIWVKYQVEMKVNHLICKTLKQGGGRRLGMSALKGAERD